MAKYVREIMNPELFSVEPEAPREDVMDFLLALGITACPVIDSAGTLRGMVTLRDLIGERGGNRVDDRVREQALTISQDALVQDAARTLTQAHAHRMIALDAQGRAAGMVSAVDLVAALSGVPVSHPPGFPNIDPVAGLSWSPDFALDSEAAQQVPSQPGVWALMYGASGLAEIPVWIEDALDLRARIDGLLAIPQEDRELAHILDRDRSRLRVRHAVVVDADARARAVRALREDAARRRRLG